MQPAGACVPVHHLDHFTTPELAACHERAITVPFGHICVSRAVARELRDGWGIGATVIPNGVDAGGSPPRWGRRWTGRTRCCGQPGATSCPGTPGRGPRQHLAFYRDCGSTGTAAAS